MRASKLIGAVSALALLSGAALAQTTPTPTPPTSPAPEAAPPTAPTAVPEVMKPPASGAATDMVPKPAAPSTMVSPATPPASGEAIAASDLMGESVIGTDGKTIGTVDDIVIDPASGRIQQIVVKSGGVLGIGGKTVAMAFEELRVAPGEGVHASRVTSDDLKSMPDFDVADATADLDRRVAPPAATGGGPAPLPTPVRPPAQ